MENGMQNSKKKTFLMSSIKCPGCKKIGDFYIRGDFQLFDDALLIPKGDIFNTNFTEQPLEFSPQNLEGRFSIILYDIKKNIVKLGTDKFAREPLLYFHDDHRFVVSDNFWEILNLLKIDATLLDTNNMKKYLVARVLLYPKTIVKNLEMFPYGALGTYNVKDNSLAIKQYWDITIEPDKNITVEKTVDKIYDTYCKVLQEIHQKNPESIYLVGLSGGLDSRLIPFFALKHNMRLISYIIGEKRPHKLFLSYDHYCARKLAKHFRLQHHEIEYNSEGVSTKEFYDLLCNPLGPSQLFNAAICNVPKSDIILEASGGYLVGGDVYGRAGDNLEKLSKEELRQKMINYFFSFGPQNKYFDIKKELRNLFNIKNQKKVSTQIEGIISTNEYKLFQKEVDNFITDNPGVSNLTIWIRFFHRLSTTTTLGAFESLLGTKKSYNLYMPLVNHVQHWKPSFFKDRLIIKKLIAKTGSSFLPSTNRDILTTSNSAFVSKTRYIFKGFIYLIRGVGVWNRIKWAKDKEFQNFAYSLLRKKNKFFNEIFDTEKIINQFKKNQIQIRLFCDIIKLKHICDIISSQNYKNFLDQGEK